MDFIRNDLLIFIVFAVGFSIGLYQLYINTKS